MSTVPAPALGTLETEFRRAYCYTDPYLVKNLGIWRLTNCQPGLPDDYYNIFGLLPIVIDNYAEPVPSANISFDIDDLQDISASALNLTSYLEPILTTLRHPITQGVANLEAIAGPPNIVGIPPIFTYKQGKGVLVTFSIEKLEYAEVFNSKKRKMGVRVYPYNRDSYVTITATPPIYQQASADTVTIDFDLTDLDYA